MTNELLTIKQANYIHGQRSDKRRNACQCQSKDQFVYEWLSCQMAHDIEWQPTKQTKIPKDLAALLLDSMIGLKKTITLEI